MNQENLNDKALQKLERYAAYLESLVKEKKVIEVTANDLQKSANIQRQSSEYFRRMENVENW